MRPFFALTIFASVFDWRYTNQIGGCMNAKSSRVPPLLFLFVTVLSPLLGVLVQVVSIFNAFSYLQPRDVLALLLTNAVCALSILAMAAQGRYFLFKQAVLVALFAVVACNALIDPQLGHLVFAAVFVLASLLSTVHLHLLALLRSEHDGNDSTLQA